MSDNKYLSNRTQAKLFYFCWCLFATTWGNPCKAQGDEEPRDYYYFHDISVQRSNFLSIDPFYEKVLEEQIKERRSMFLWKFRFDAEGLQTDKNINSQNVGVTTQGKFVYKMMKDLSFNALVNLNLQSGRSQDIFGDLEPKSGIFPREMNLKWSPNDGPVSVRLGQINQRWLNEPLFISSGLGFPGLQESLLVRSKSRRYEFTLTAQQLIPTSSTLATRVSSREPTPLLTTETLGGRIHFDKGSFVSGRLTHYSYTRLPFRVGFDSSIYGNTTSRGDQNNTRFIYDFDGFMSQLEYQQALSKKLSSVVQWNVIKNMKAPDDMAEAQSVTLHLLYDFGDWMVGGNYRNYFIEGDAVPAAYNNHRLGHSNRIGHTMELVLESKEWGILFRGMYTKADLLNEAMVRLDGLQQDNQQTFYFSVETMYDFI